MQAHQRLSIVEPSQVGEARRTAQALGRELGFDDVACGRLGLAATELGTNLVRHARDGSLLLRACAPDAVELVAWDHGPGMDLTRCLRDGYSTAGTAGEGLGAVQRASDRFSAYSLPGRSSVIALRVQRAPTVSPSPFEVGMVGLAAPGEQVSGDGWGWHEADGRVSLLVADGLGHGPDAAVAADTAVTGLAGLRGDSPAATLTTLHDALRSTRGAAAALASFSATDTGLRYAGAGNICGRLISGVSDRSLMSQHGTLGVQIRRLQDMAYDWPPHGILVMHSDGIATRWTLDDAPGLLQCDPTVIAAWILREHCRGRDDATVVVVKRREH